MGMEEEEDIEVVDEGEEEEITEPTEAKTKTVTK